MLAAGAALAPAWPDWGVNRGFALQRLPCLPELVALAKADRLIHRPAPAPQQAAWKMIKCVETA